MLLSLFPLVAGWLTSWTILHRCVIKPRSNPTGNQINNWMVLVEQQYMLQEMLAKEPANKIQFSIY